MPKFLLSFITILISAEALIGAASAAPLWVERRFVLAPDLIDPVFAERDAASQITVDHTPWDAFLTDYVVEDDSGVNLVRYRAVTDEDRAALDAYVDALQEVDVTTLNADAQFAFWINVYNAVTVQAIMDAPGIKSIRDIDSVWDVKEVTVNGIDLSLNDIEHRIIRPVYGDPRVHYAVNCASIGCPNLARKAYTGETLDAMLDAAARAYVNHPRGINVDGRKVFASKIFGWYREDFGADEAAVLEHVRAYAEPALRDALGGRTKINDYGYDWGLNIAP